MSLHRDVVIATECTLDEVDRVHCLEVHEEKLLF